MTEVSTILFQQRSREHIF
ncbi:UNVERIFIED_CONTAM: hypothetical protein GTU68_026131 [Idotea baltica]|nr:hypothetical protein [Idotea baltica]